jgi:pyrimidine-specific ribonucleoside hydrolase
MLIRSLYEIGIFTCLLFISCKQSVTATKQVMRLVVDTDAGTDDMMALAFLLSRTDIELEAVTVGPGLAHANAGATNVRRLLKLAGREDVPVYVGHENPYEGGNYFPEEWRQASDELKGVQLPEVETENNITALEFMKKRFADGDHKVVVLALGGLTNLSSVLSDSHGKMPGISRLVIMGGAISAPGNVKYGGDSTNTTAEWNFYVDAVAAQKVFSSGIPITLIPLDATSQVAFNRDYISAMKAKSSCPLARVVAELLESTGERLDEGEVYAWDQLAALSLIDPGVVTTQIQTLAIRLEAPEEGRSALADNGAKTNVAYAANAERFREVFVNSLGGCVK